MSAGCWFYLILSVLILAYLAIGISLAAALVEIEDRRITNMNRAGLPHPKDQVFTLNHYAKAVLCWPAFLFGESK